jgi:ring-1,2-phenylacetyl-CoA epoxidase subunit PaaE
LPALAPAAAIDRAFLCGPAAMMDEAAATLSGRGVPPRRILRELFLPGEGGRPVALQAAAEPAAPAAVASIIIDGRGHEVSVPEGVSIIDAARDAGLDLPYSCRAGMCCTCRARLVDGRADMAANYSLQKWEIERGFILTCQARPLTPRLTLDYDAV